MSIHAARVCLVSLLLAEPLTPAPVHAVEHAWRAVTEAGVTFQPAESPIEQSGHATHWRWTGVAGAVRKIGFSSTLGPVFLGAYSEHDYTLGAGLRWERDLVEPWSFHVMPGFAVHDLVKGDSDAFKGTFAEVGFSYRRAVTLAARLEGITYLPQNYFGEPPTERVTDRVVRLDLRMGKAPGAVALGAAAVAVLGYGVIRATDAE